MFCDVNAWVIIGCVLISLSFEYHQKCQTHGLIFSNFVFNIRLGDVAQMLNNTESMEWINKSTKILNYNWNKTKQNGVAFRGTNNDVESKPLRRTILIKFILFLTALIKIEIKIQ